MQIAMKTTKQSDGFTLMEVIIAVAIVSIMAGALAPVIYHEINMARSAATSRELDLLKDGLLDFYEDTGRFPAEAEGLAALVTDPGVTGWRGPYIGSGQDDPLTAAVTDPFGRAYLYDLDPTVDPVNSANLVVASMGIDRVQDMPDQAQTWILSHISDHDDIVCFISANPLNREKIDKVLEELDALADAARVYYRTLGSFPDPLSTLQDDYIDSGYQNDAFVDSWNNNYLTQILSGSAPVLQMWSIGPDRQNDGGAADDLLIEINSAVLDNEQSSQNETEGEVQVIQNAIDADPGVNLNGSWHSVRIRLGLSAEYETDEWGAPYHVKVAERVIFSSGPDMDENTTSDNIPQGMGP